MRSGHPRRSRGAFDVLWLLVTVVVVLLLAVLVIPHLGFLGGGDAKIAVAKTDISTFSTLVEQYKKDTGKYPTTADGLQALRINPKGVTNWRGPYVNKASIPNDPWGNPYVYQSPGPAKQSYLITSYGRDGKPGGEGEAADLTSGGH